MSCWGHASQYDRSGGVGFPFPQLLTKILPVPLHSTKFLYHVQGVATSYNLKTLRRNFVYLPAGTSFSSTRPPIPDSTSPLIVLLGWFNSSPKNLRHYVSIYTETFGMDTLSHIPPYYNVFFPWRLIPHSNRLAQELVTFWVSQGKPDVGFHIFSNNGAYHYGLLCEALRQLASSPSSLLPGSLAHGAKSFLQAIRSCVMDSAPSPISDKLVASGIMGGMLMRHSKPNSDFTADSTLSTKPPAFLLPIISLFFSLPTTKEYQEFAHEALANIPRNRVKYLFMYGPGDHIVTEEQVLKFMGLLKSRGVMSVDEKRFAGGSGHVQHYLRYPGEYLEALRVFYGVRGGFEKDAASRWKPR